MKYKIKKNFLIVSNYNNDLSWIPAYTNQYLIYDQGEGAVYPKGIDPKKVIKSEHTGHNISDHLTFIIDHYDQLPDCTIFAKGNIFPRHITQKNFDKIINHSTFTPIEDTETNQVGKGVSFFENGGFNEINNDWYVSITTKRLPARYARRYNHFLAQIFQDPRYPKFIRFAPGANYILPREYIRRYPKVFYENLRAMVSYAYFPVEAYFAERALYTIWTSTGTLSENILKEPMRTLDEIALSYGTDKSSLSHNYTKLYALYFDPIRHAKLKILEIGIDKGYSLKSWKEYFNNAEITGIDILDLTRFEEERVHVMQGDQSDRKFLKKVHDTHGPFDIIIDDGSHHNDHMKASFDYLFPLLKPGGIYVVEDLHACYWGKTHGTGKPVFINRLKELIDCVNSSGKSGTANIRRDEDDGWYNQRKMPPMTWWERNVESLDLYRSIVFIKKYSREPLKDALIRKVKRVKRLNPLTVARKVKSVIVKKK